MSIDYEPLFHEEAGLRDRSPLDPTTLEIVDAFEERLRMRLDRVKAALDNSAHNMQYTEERRLRRRFDYWDYIETLLHRWRHDVPETLGELTDCRTYACPARLTKSDVFRRSGYCERCFEYAQRGEAPPLPVNALPRPVWNT